MKLTIDSTLKMNDGRAIPRLGLGVYLISEGRSCEAALRHAFEAGYRHIDTAAFYRNEEGVGRAVRKSGIPREKIFVTTKLWNSDHDNPEQALEASLRNLKMEYVDLYLIHYPVPERQTSWRLLEKLHASGKARSIGVSNYTIKHLHQLLADSGKVPAVNQVELHPYLYQYDLMDFCRSKGIVVAAYSPLTHGQKLKDKKLIAIANKYSKSTAQLLIRWALQHDVVALPKSATSQRIAENAAVFDFEIDDADMQTLDRFNENLRTCWDPTNAP